MNFDHIPCSCRTKKAKDNAICVLNVLVCGVGGSHSDNFFSVYQRKKRGSVWEVMAAFVNLRHVINEGWSSHPLIWSSSHQASLTPLSLWTERDFIPCALRLTFRYVSPRNQPCSLFAFICSSHLFRPCRFDICAVGTERRCRWLIVVRVYFVYANHLVLKVQNHSQALFTRKLRKFSTKPLVKIFFFRF